MKRDAPTGLSCADKLKELDKLYGQRKRAADKAVEQGRSDWWKFVQEQLDVEDEMLRIEAREARKIIKRLSREDAPVASAP